MKQTVEVPAVRATRSTPQTAAQVDEVYKPPYLYAAIAGSAVFLLYAITLAPTTQFWDTSEYIATAHIMGIPHPPGNPLFVVLARAWDLLLTPTGLPVAVRINLFSTTMSALAHGFWFLLAHRILAYQSPSARFRLIGAAAAVLLSATAFTVWNQSNVNEKVYTVSLFTIALLSWLAFRWRDHVGEGKDDNLILLVVFILALSVGNHLMAFLAAPALAVFILIVHPKTLANWKLYAAAVVAAVLGLSIHLYLPIRAGLAPVINEADPSCPGLFSAIQSVLTMGASGCAELSDALARQQYDKPPMHLNPTVYPAQLLPRDASLLFAQILNYFQYFDWQWARSAAGNISWFGGVRPLLTVLFSALGILGLLHHYRRDRISFTYMALLFLTLSFGLIVYLNFKYGFTFPGDNLSVEMREVRERDYFFIVSFSLWGIWAGVGLATLWRDAQEWLASRAPKRQNLELLTAPLLGLALLPLVLNWTWASRSRDYSARDWSYNLLMSLEPYAILFTNGDNDTFPLWYLQEVEGVRRDVTVMVMSYLNTDWYARQIRDLTTPCAQGQDPLADETRILCQRPFEPDKAPAFYGQAMVPPDQPGVTPSSIPPGRRAPLRTILPLDDATINQIATTPATASREAQVFKAGLIESTIPPGTYLIPADIYMAQMIVSAIDDRPIYYAMTTAAYDDLHLRPFLIRQGLAYKLNNGPVQPDSTRGIYAVPEVGALPALLGPYIDLTRTETLLNDVFVHRGGFPDRWNHWVDSATEGIPMYYAYTHFGVSAILERLGNTTGAAEHSARGQLFYTLAMKRNVRN
jgi:hypothetical protein